tara:strand:- start:778 stop:963 length:186 start_codon:yes stop_codon:yes gene_type:complete
MGSNKTKIKKEKIKGYSYLQKIIADKELLGVWSKVHALEQSLEPVNGWDRDDFFHWTKLPR